MINIEYNVLMHVLCIRTYENLFFFILFSCCFVHLCINCFGVLCFLFFLFFVFFLLVLYSCV